MQTKKLNMFQLGPPPQTQKSFALFACNSRFRALRGSGNMLPDLDDHDERSGNMLPDLDDHDDWSGNMLPDP